MLVVSLWIACQVGFGGIVVGKVVTSPSQNRMASKSDCFRSLFRHHVQQCIDDHQTAVPDQLLESLLAGQIRVSATVNIPLYLRQQTFQRKPAADALMDIMEAALLAKTQWPTRDKQFRVMGVEEVLSDDEWVSMQQSVCEAYAQWRGDPTAERFTLWLNQLGKPGLLRLLDHRCTLGTLDRLCPSIGVLVESFTRLHRPSSRLTVGARALCKHGYRSNDFWPELRGNEQNKNRLASETVLRVLDQPAWVNVHVVPAGGGQQLSVVEVRHESGHGARWTADGSSFRGFLEPVSPFYDTAAKHYLQSG